MRATRVRRAASALVTLALAVTLGAVTSPAASANQPGIVTPIVTQAVAPAVTQQAPRPATTVTTVGTAEPVIIVVDTSGSMNDDDGNSTIKLTGAKRSIGSIISMLSPSTTFGVWSYPGGTVCSPGSYVVSPKALGDGIEATALVDAMVAVGDTPTGPALEQVASELTTAGHSGATIVLISDGESNCGTPPCTVAQNLVDQGFNVTVSTIGFRTSQAGLDELSCVSAATGGTAVTADDSEQLTEQLTSLMASQLSLDINYSTEPLTGGTTAISATIALAGGESALDVRTTLAFSGDQTTHRLPAVLPPRVMLGNTDGTHTLTTEWIVSTGAFAAEADYSFTVSAWASNAPRVTATGTYSTKQADPTSNDLGEMFAGVSAKHPLVIFGDSYSSGTGAGPYDKPSDTRVSQGCNRSPKTYLAPRFEQDAVVNLACHGAISSHLTAVSKSATVSQLTQYAGLNKAASVGVVTFGGNDVGFEGFVKTCLFWTCATNEFIAAKFVEVNDLKPDLIERYRLLWGALNTEDEVAARDGAFAPLIVLPYPRATDGQRFKQCDVLDPWEELAADMFTLKLNSMLKSVVNTLRKDGYEIYFVEDAADAFLPGHSICEQGATAYIHGLVWPTSESFHPKDTGYQAITDRVIAWSQVTPRVAHSLSPKRLAAVRALAAAENSFTKFLTTPLPRPVTIPLDASPVLYMASAGQPVRFTGSGYLPGSPVTLTIHSTPTIVGTLIANEDGTIDGELRIPDSVEIGQHTIVTSSLTADGEFRRDEISVSISAPIPLWIALCAGLAVLLLLAAAIVLVRARVKRRRFERQGEATGVEPAHAGPAGIEAV